MTRRSTAPDHVSRWAILLAVATAGLLLAACGDDSALTTTTGASTTMEATTTAPATTSTTTTTAPAAALLSGTVHLVDRDEPVSTHIELIDESGGEAIETVDTDADGFFTFSVTEPGDYSLKASIMDLLDMCDGLRISPPLGTDELPAWVALTEQRLDSTGTTDILIPSLSRTMSIGADGTATWGPLDAVNLPEQTEWVADLPMSCDPE